MFAMPGLPVPAAEAAAGHTCKPRLSRLSLIAAACPLATIEINAYVTPVPAAKAAAGHTLELSLSWLQPRAIPSDLFVPFQHLLGRQTLIAAACPLATIEINTCVTPVPAAEAAAGHTLEPSPLGGGGHGRFHRSLPRPRRDPCAGAPLGLGGVCRLRPRQLATMRCDLRVAEINARAMPVPTAHAAAGHALELSLSWLLPPAIPSARPIPKKIDLVQDRSEPELPANHAAASQRLRRG